MLRRSDFGLCVWLAILADCGPGIIGERTTVLVDDGVIT